MHIDIEIPDGFVDVIAPGQDPARAALEAIALEGYRSDRLSEYDVQELLRFETRMEVHAFLKEHGVHRHYRPEELELDMREADRMLATLNARETTGERPKGRIVVADTGPINYLIWIGQIDVLPKLYTTVLIPEAVRDELRKPGAPEFVRRWIEAQPEWLEVREPIRAPDIELMRVRIGPGERDAILLAEESGAEVLVVDDQRGRKEAERRKTAYGRHAGRAPVGLKKGTARFTGSSGSASHDQFLHQRRIDRPPNCRDKTMIRGSTGAFLTPLYDA